MADVADFVKSVCDKVKSSLDDAKEEGRQRIIFQTRAESLEMKVRVLEDVHRRGLSRRSSLSEATQAKSRRKKWGPSTPPEKTDKAETTAKPQMDPAMSTSNGSNGTNYMASTGQILN